MNKQIINTKNAPSPVGPYNQSVKVGNMLFVSGQIAINPETGTLVQGTIEEETRQVMENLGQILKAASMGFQNVVKASVFVTDMHNYAQINGIYAQYFDEETAPARELVEVRNLPKFVNVEISVIASE
jgi:2-iminobutanoate/2-iminopropanoate deaminase